MKLLNRNAVFENVCDSGRYFQTFQGTIKKHLKQNCGEGRGEHEKEELKAIPT